MGLLYFSRVAQQRAYRQEITMGLGLASNTMLLAIMNATFICPFISIFEPLQVQSTHLAHRFQMASICCLVKCVLMCGVECRGGGQGGHNLSPPVRFCPFVSRLPPFIVNHAVWLPIQILIGSVLALSKIKHCVVNRTTSHFPARSLKRHSFDTSLHHAAKSS